MQCASCHFENMPGTAVCGRCGTSMTLGATQVSVHPPRARPMSKRFRRISGGRRLIPWRMPKRRAASGAPAFRSPYGSIQGAVLARLIVPGWAHFYLGRTARGRIFLGAYLALVVAALLFLGTALQNFLVGLAFSAHVSSVIDIVLPIMPSESRRARIFTAVGCMCLLLFLVYFPLGWLITRGASPRMILLDSAPFRSGDVVLMNQWAFLRSPPHPGQVVLYQLAYGERREMHGDDGIYYRYMGERIDRIIAGPNDHVDIQNGAIWVNGQHGAFLPLSPANLPVKISFVVPADEYLILPSGTLNAADSNDLWQTLSRVPASQISGVVYLREPLSRFWIIR